MHQPWGLGVEDAFELQPMIDITWNINWYSGICFKNQFIWNQYDPDFKWDAKYENGLAARYENQ